MFLILLCSSTRFILDSFYIMTLEKTQKKHMIMSVQVTVFFHVNIVFVRLDVMVVMLKEQSSPNKKKHMIMSVQVTVFFHVNIVFVRLDVMVVMLKEQSSPLGTERYSHANSFLRSC